MALFKWSRTAASNGAADSTCPFPEGMSPSAYNDGARGMMAAVAQYRDDIAGAIVTTGTSTAYSVASFSGFDSLADMDKQIIAFTPHVTNGDTVTLTTDSLGTKPLRSAPGVELVSGTLVQGTPYTALYNNTDGAWYLRGFYSSPYNVPFLGGMDFWDTVAPNSRFIFPQGQAISRTVYAAAFARWGTKFGAGDGSTTFNVPDKTGRVSAMMEAVATRLTAAAGGVDGATMGSAAGAQTETLLTANLPPYTPAGTIAVAGTTNITTTPTGAAVGSGGNTIYGISGANGSQNLSLNVSVETFTGTAQGGTSAPVKTVQPTIVCNYIIRIL